ncbi:hypothetical protein SP15_142 [Bacillus phage SP-15]|uniref:Uncharacterized protein n=1 Tax=Bacillus phage SP-15 TaxID=1792032 RepID=A0A127AWC1_9CAUD|nr:hypothetical protein SP15_142 [Bacillus phage SP-15]AMM44940.1 hypothetical protein SP15_142 [Bacillus phage SP-15]
MSNIESLAIDLLKQLDCPYDTDGTLKTRKANMLRVQACMRVSHGIESSNSELEGVINQLESDSVDMGVKGLRQYVKTMHSSVVANMNLHSKLIYKMVMEDNKRR